MDIIECGNRLNTKIDTVTLLYLHKKKTNIGLKTSKNEEFVDGIAPKLSFWSNVTMSFNYSN